MLFSEANSTFKFVVSCNFYIMVFFMHLVYSCFVIGGRTVLNCLNLRCFKFSSVKREYTVQSFKKGEG